MRPWVKVVIGSSLFIFTIVFIIIWDTMIKDEISSASVVVIKPGVIIEKNEVINADKILVEKRSISSLIEGVVYEKDMSKVIGYEAKQQLLGNTILSKRFVDYDFLTPDPEKGESIRPIPNEWIYASPSTIRRKDYIDFYLFKPEDMMEFNQNLAFQGLSPEQKLKLKELNEQNEKENKKYQTEREQIAKDKGLEVVKEEGNVMEDTKELLDEVDSVTEEVDTVVKGEKITGTDQQRQRERIMKALEITEDEWLQYAENGEIPMLVDIPIVYVKDGAGNEIQNGENSTEEKRLSSTGPVSDLEVLMNEDEYRSIKKYMGMGYKIYITYN